MSDHLMEETASAAVEKGAMMLDTLHPGWFVDINPDDVIMGKYGHDVLAHLHGTTYHGMATLGITEDKAIEGGFKIHHEELSRRFATAWRRNIRHMIHVAVHNDHTAAWRRAIRKRQQLHMDNKLLLG